MNMKTAESIAGTLGFPSKMPGTSYGIPATACHVGAKLAKVAGSVCSNCYALKGRYVFGSVQQSQNTRLESLTSTAWVDAMVFMLRRAHGLDEEKRVHVKIQAGGAGWHRWHDSGDLQSLQHLENIVEVCRRTPEIRHWLPTREAGVVLQWRKKNEGSSFPFNLCIRVSATMIDGGFSKAFTNTSTVHKNAIPDGHVCPAPSQNNSCKNCRACWNTKISNVSYHVH